MTQPDKLTIYLPPDVPTIQHVYPLNDLREHETDGEPCWCNPRIEEDGKIVVHNSMDRREEYEEGRKMS